MAVTLMDVIMTLTQSLRKETILLKGWYCVKNTLERHSLDRRMTDTDTPRAQLDVDRFETAVVNANGQVYLGRDLEGVKVHVAVEIVDEQPD